MRMECCDWEQVRCGPPASLPSLNCSSIHCNNVRGVTALQVKQLPEASLLPALPKSAKVVRPLEGKAHPLPSNTPHCILIMYSPAVIKEQSRVLIVFPLCECNLLHLLQQVPHTLISTHTRSNANRTSAQEQRQESGRAGAKVYHVRALPPVLCSSPVCVTPCS